VRTASTSLLHIGLCLAVGALLGAGMVAWIPAAKIAENHEPQREHFIAAPLLTAKDDPGVQAMQQINDPAQQRVALFNVMTRLARVDLDQALTLLPNDASHDHVLRDWIFDRLLKTQPALATRAASQLDLSNGRNELIVECLQGWRKQDGGQAAQWARTMLDADLAKAIVDKAMEDDPAFAGRLLLSLPANQSEALLARLLHEWATLDAADAMRFIETITPARLTPRALQGLGTSLVAVPPSRLRSWLDTLSDAARATVAEEMVSALPAMTTESQCEAVFVQTQALSASRDALAQWMSALALLDPDRAQSFLSSTSVGIERDAAVMGIARASAQRDHALALQWTREIRDASQRTAEARTQWLAWLRDHRADALDWLTSNESSAVLDARTMQSLMNRYQPKP
jgi:hypothetical protein